MMLFRLLNLLACWVYCNVFGKLCKIEKAKQKTYYLRCNWYDVLDILDIQYLVCWMWLSWSPSLLSLSGFRVVFRVRAVILYPGYVSGYE
jgi:hypothetical protein